MSERQIQQAVPTETETPLTQEAARLLNLGMRLALYIACLSVVSAIILFALFSTPPPLWSQCEAGDPLQSPLVVLSATPTPGGYEFEIEFASREVPCDCYKVAVLKDGASWAGFPKIVVDGGIGLGPADEYLSFTDLNSDGSLSLGDFFAMERLEPGTEYELILLWASTDNKIAHEVITGP